MGERLPRMTGRLVRTLLPIVDDAGIVDRPFISDRDVRSLDDGRP
jgi:hypothetical protein